MRRLALLILTGLVFALVGTAPAAAQGRLFSQDSELHLTIEGPITTLARNAARVTDPVPATLTVTDGAQPQAFQIQLSPRGFTRRTGGYCHFPPLRLDFDHAAVHGTLFSGQNKLKLVTRCTSDTLIALEYTVYRLYNELTPLSFRVRPATVTYRNQPAPAREQTQFNFLIEDVDDVASRNHLTAIDVGAREAQPSQLDGDQAALAALFQFMVGNLDWELVRGPEGEDCCHNGKLLAASATARDRLMPIPYDFDFSGFVNAPYAIPPPNVHVANVRTRYYRGYCSLNAHMPATLERFRTHRAALYAIVDGETRIPDARRQAAHRYLDSFFQIIDNPAAFNTQVIEHCR